MTEYNFFRCRDRKQLDQFITTNGDTRIYIIVPWDRVEDLGERFAKTDRDKELGDAGHRYKIASYSEVGIYRGHRVLVIPEDMEFMLHAVPNLTYVKGPIHKPFAICVKQEISE